MAYTTRWQNYLGNVRCEAPIDEPRTLVELARTVRVRATQGRIRAVGGGYAWTPLVPTAGSLIRLTHLDRCLDVSPESDPPSVRVECGMRVGQAQAHARAAGLVLCSPPMFNAISIGGALATGSHGSDTRNGCFSDSLLSATLITASGEVVEIDAPEDLAALGVSLGSMGILYAVRLRCEPLFSVYSEERWRDLDATLEELPELVDRVPFAQLWWFPHARRIGVKGMFPIAAPIPKRSFSARVERWLRDQAAVAGAAWLIPAVARLRPSLSLPLFSLGEGIALRPAAGIRCITDELHFHQGYAPCWDMSFCVPIERTREAWLRLTSYVLRRQARGVHPVNTAVYARFTGTSRCHLAANHGRASCFLEVVSARGTPGVERHFAELAEHMLEIPESRMHWGKHIPEVAPLLCRYPAMSRFLRAREALDPRGIFLNAFLEREVFAL